VLASRHDKEQFASFWERIPNCIN